MNRPLITRRDSLLGDLSAGHTGYEYLSEERSIPKEAEDAKKILQDLILQEIKICNRLTEYLEFWQTQMRRSPWLVRLEFMSPWNPDGVEPEELKQNARTCATSLMSRLTRLGGDLHEHNLMAGRIDSKAAGVWSRRAWTLIHRCLDSPIRTSPKKMDSPAAIQKRLTVRGVEAQLTERIEEMHMQIGHAVPPFWWRWGIRKWMLFPYNTISVPLVLGTGVYVVTNYAGIIQGCTTFLQSLRDFFRTHIYEPCEAICGEIFFRHNEQVMDREALKMSRESLQKMLKSYFDEKFPSLPEDERVNMAKNMDMKAVSEEYAQLVNYAVTNTIRGDIPRLALIRMQFVEKEMLGLMDSVDLLLDKNEVNMQFTATVPAVVLLYFCYRFLTVILNRVTGKKSLHALSLHMRKEMLRLDRLLNLKDADTKTKLSALDMGKAIIIIHRLREQLSMRESRLDAHEVEAMRTDLKEILGAFGPVTVRQQLAIIRRMQLSYRTVQS